MTTKIWTPEDIKVEWYAPLYRGATLYELKVFGPYSEGTYDVEVYVNATHCGTKTLSRNTHVIGDMFDFVTKCIAIEEDVLFNDAETLGEYNV